MKNLLFCLITICTLQANAQQAATDTLKGFWGVNFGSNKAQTKDILKAKGILNVKTKDLKNGIEEMYVPDTKFGNYTADFVIIFFVNDSLYHGQVQYKPLQNGIKDMYLHLKADIDGKYFAGKFYTDFKSPYKEGDGNEEAALQANGATYVTYWTFAKNVISLETLYRTDGSIITLNYQDKELVKEAVKKSNKTSDY